MPILAQNIDSNGMALCENKSERTNDEATRQMLGLLGQIITRADFDPEVPYYPGFADFRHLPGLRLGASVLQVELPHTIGHA